MRTRPLLYIKIFIITGILVLLGFYFFHQTKDYFLGPRIIVEQPENGSVFTHSLISVKGRAFNASGLFLNGQPILADSFGNFEENLLLARGYNIIELSAKDKFSREVKEKLEVVIK